MKSIIFSGLRIVCNFLNPSTKTPYKYFKRKRVKFKSVKKNERKKGRI